MNLWYNNAMRKIAIAAFSIALFAFAQSEPPSPRPSEVGSAQDEKTDGKADKGNGGQDLARPISSKKEQPHTGDDKQSTPFNNPTDLIAAFATVVIAVATVAQACIYRKQTIVMRDALAQTTNAANAAMKQVNLTIAKERARLSVITAHTPDMRQFIAADDFFVRVAIGNDGATKAFNVELSIDCFAGEPKQITIPRLPFRYFLGVISAEQSDSISAEHLLSCSPEDFELIKNGQLKLRMHSVVSYVDIFDQRKTFANSFVFHPFPTLSEPRIDWVPVDPTMIVTVNAHASL